MIKNLSFKISSSLIFFVAFTSITSLWSFKSFGEEKLLKEEKNYRDKAKSLVTTGFISKLNL